MWKRRISVLIAFFLSGVALAGPIPTQKDMAAWMDKYVAKQAQPGSDGAVTVEILSFRVGKTRKWQRNDGGNPDNGHDTLVYPIKLHYLRKTHYNTRTVVEDHDCGYTSFQDAFGDWKFGQSADPEVQSQHDDPPDVK